MDETGSFWVFQKNPDSPVRSHLEVLSPDTRLVFLSQSPVRAQRWFLVNSVSICEYLEQLVCADLPSACRVWLYILNRQKEAVLFLLWGTFRIELVEPTSVILPESALIYQPHLAYREFRVLSASWGCLTGEGRLCMVKAPIKWGAGQFFSVSSIQLHERIILWRKLTETKAKNSYQHQLTRCGFGCICRVVLPWSIILVEQPS